MNVVVVAALVMFAGFVPVNAAAKGHGAPSSRIKVAVAVVVVGNQVDASGTASGAVPVRRLRAKWRAVLQQRVATNGHAIWRVRAQARVGSHGRRATFSLRWADARLGPRAQIRVRIISGRKIVATSATKSARPAGPIAVHSVLRPTAVQAAPKDVLSVAGAPDAVQTILIAKGAHVPGDGGALVVLPSTDAPDGVLGVVTSSRRQADGSVQLTTRAGVLEDAYSAFEAHINGTIGDLAAQARPGASPRLNLPALDAIFSCDKPDVKDSIVKDIDLSGLTLQADIYTPSFSTGFTGPGVTFNISGRPKLSFGVRFSGKATCTAQESIPIPIPNTPGLVVKIGPEFTLEADGKVGVSFEWSPYLSFGFIRFKGRPDSDFKGFANSGTTAFDGAAKLSLSLALRVEISLRGKIGVKGTAGPQVTGRVTTDAVGSCLDADAELDADLTAFADVFFKHYRFRLGSWAFGQTPLYHNCTSTGATPAPAAGGASPPGPGPPAGGPAPTLETTLISRSSGVDGVKGDAESQSPSLSDDGRYVAFSSIADNLAGIDAPPLTSDVFVRDRLTGVTTRLTLSDSNGASFQGDSPAISGDGRFVTFDGLARNADPNDMTPGRYVLAHDMQTGVTTVVSRASGAGGALGDHQSDRSSISRDGRFIAFESAATNFNANDADVLFDVYVRDTATNTTTLVSRATGLTGVKGNGVSGNPAISADGRYVAFSSTATNLTADSVSGNFAVYRRDLLTNTTTLVSRATGAAGAAADGDDPSISADGRFIAFGSSANLDGDNGINDIFVRDMQADSTTLVSRASGAAGVASTGQSFYPAISADGTKIAFQSVAGNLDEAALGGVDQMYVRNLVDQTTSLVSRQTGAAGTVGNGSSTTGPQSASAVSGDGRFVTFSSLASNLSPADADATSDVFVRGISPAL